MNKKKEFGRPIHGRGFCNNSCRFVEAVFVMEGTTRVPLNIYATKNTYFTVRGKEEVIAHSSSLQNLVNKTKKAFNNEELYLTGSVIVYKP